MKTNPRVCRKSGRPLNTEVMPILSLEDIMGRAVQDKPDVRLDNTNVENSECNPENEGRALSREDTETDYTITTDSQTYGHFNAEVEVFADTATKLHPLVMTRLQALGMSLLTEACSEASVQLEDSGSDVTLRGQWNAICEVKRKITQILQSTPQVHRNEEFREPASTIQENMDTSLPEQQLEPTPDQSGGNCDSGRTFSDTSEYPVNENTIDFKRLTDLPDKRSTRNNTTNKVDRSISCAQCLQKFRKKVDLNRHVRVHHSSPSQTLAPEGETRELSELSTPQLKVLVDSHNKQWYQCRECLLTGSRKFRMAAHYHVSHTENKGVRFKIVAKQESQDTITNLDPSDTIEESKGGSMSKSPKISRLQQKHPEKITEECKKCGYKTSVSGLRAHMRTKHTNYMYMCEVCEKSFNTLFALRSHFRTHVSVDATNKLKEFKCDKCGKKFNRNVDLVHHKNLGRSCSEKPQDSKFYNPPYVEGKYACEVCGYTAKQRVHVVQHHARRHAPKEFSCDQCTQKFAFERDLKIHQTVSHAVEKAHRCEACGKCFASAKYLASHKLRHDDVKKHFCTVCNKGFLEKYRMLMHLEIHKVMEDRTKLYPCTVCGKPFTSDSYRKDHENIHTGKKPYTCKVCGKSLKAQSHMWKHMQTHHSKKKHECPVCKKSFKFKTGLTAHLVTHTGVGKHQCDKCEKVYTQRQTLLRHVCKSSALTVQNPQENLDGEMALTHVNTDEVELSSPTQQNAYMCSECNEIFQEWNEIQQHMLSHTSVCVTKQDLTVPEEEGSYTLEILDLPGELPGPAEQGDSVITVDIVDSETGQTVTEDIHSAGITIATRTVTDSGPEKTVEEWSMLAGSASVDKQFQVEGSDSASSVVFIDTGSAIQVSSTAAYGEPSSELIQQVSLPYQNSLN